MVLRIDPKLVCLSDEPVNYPMSCSHPRSAIFDTMSILRMDQLVQRVISADDERSSCTAVLKYCVRYYDCTMLSQHLRQTIK